MKYRTNFKTSFSVVVIMYFTFIILSIAIEQYDSGYKGAVGVAAILGLVVSFAIATFTLYNLDIRKDDEN
jgi:uncharacterized Tic20 family protein